MGNITFTSRRIVSNTLNIVGLKKPIKEYILEGTPEFFGYPSILEPDLIRHWSRVLQRSRRLLQSLPPANGPRVLFLSTLARKLSWPAPAAVIAYALRLRGAQPIIVACDRWLGACENAFNYDFPNLNEYVQHGPRKLCPSCYDKSGELYSSLGLPFYRLSEFLTQEASEKVEDFLGQIKPDQIYNLEYNGLLLKGFIESTMLRLLMMHSCPTAPEYYPIWERHARSAVLYVEVLQEMFRRLSPDVITVDWGGYLARGIPVLVAKAQGIRSTVFQRGYQRGTVKISTGGNIAVELSERDTGIWDEFHFTPERRLKVLNWIKRRAMGKDFRISNKEPITDEVSVGNELSKLGLDLQRPIFSLYSGLGFDSKLFYDTLAYPDMEDWVYETIEIFAKRPSLQLAIRLHPDELLSSSTGSHVPVQNVAKQTMATKIRHRFPNPPSNVFVIEPTNSISSYALALMSRAVLVYGTTFGFEAAALGKSVIVAGNAPYRKKGFTYDVNNREEYPHYIDHLAETAPYDPLREERAQRFGYYYVFARELHFAHWPIGFSPPKPWWHTLRSLEDLLPGRDPNLDAICDNYLFGREALAPGSI